MHAALRKSVMVRLMHYCVTYTRFDAVLVLDEVESSLSSILVCPILHRCRLLVAVVL